jgi:hypothetical protein
LLLCFPLGISRELGHVALWSRSIIFKLRHYREKFTKERNAARKHAAEYFERFPKDRYKTEVENWREIQSSNIEFVMKRLREPVEAGG